MGMGLATIRKFQKCQSINQSFTCSEITTAVTDNIWEKTAEPDNKAPDKKH